MEIKESKMLDEIILGHNQFFGVNHLVAQAGNQREAYFSDVSRIMDIIKFCYEQDVRGLMMSTHERATLVTEEIIKEKENLGDLGVYLLVPYVAKYIKQANEKGLVNIVRDSLSGTSFGEKFSMFMRGGMGIITKDVRKMLTAMMDFEIAPFRELNLRAIFLHDVMTDLILGWQMADVLELYYNHIQEKYNTTPAFCTKNLPRLMQLLEKTSIRNPLIMASINKVGYQVSPSREAFEACLENYDLQLLAMSTLAAGYLKPREAYEYLYSLPKIDSVVVGLSKKDHAIETFTEIRTQIEKRQARVNGANLRDAEVETERA